MKTQHKEISCGITAPAGFLAHGMSAGIKSSFFKKGSRKPKDLALVCSITPAVAVGAFTTNSCKAAPVLVSQARIARGIAQAIVINSGNANCARGPQGRRDAKTMTECTAQALGSAEESVLVASTGVIGKALPIDKIKKAIPALAKHVSPKGSKAAAEAILTTDTAIKEKAVEITCGGKKVKIGGIAKGAGMIAPRLKCATMLCVITTDASIRREPLAKAFENALHVSFNAISIDGCMSTNDTVVCLANAQAQNAPLDFKEKDFYVFCDALTYVMKELAAMIVEDAEGAKKLVRIHVRGAANLWQAKETARALGDYLLFKVMLSEGLTNWGRVVAGCGQAKTAIDQEKLEVHFCGEKIIDRGVCVAYNAAKVKKAYRGKELSFVIDLHSGKYVYTFLTADISKHYVTINTTYG